MAMNYISRTKDRTDNKHTPISGEAVKYDQAKELHAGGIKRRVTVGGKTFEETSDFYSGPNPFVPGAGALLALYCSGGSEAPKPVRSAVAR